jgi:hypothetical protein
MNLAGSVWARSTTILGFLPSTSGPPTACMTRRRLTALALVALLALGAAGCSRTATHESGDTSDYDYVTACSQGGNPTFTYDASQEVSAYEGSWEAKAQYHGEGSRCRNAGGRFRVSAPDGYEGYYGAAFYFPQHSLTEAQDGSPPLIRDRLNIMTWDNDADYYPTADFGGIQVRGGSSSSTFNGLSAAFVRGRFHPYPDEPDTVQIGDTFHLGEGCWNWVAVHQKLSDKPAADPEHAITEVFVNGAKVVDTTAPNSYGRIARDIRFGTPYMGPDQVGHSLAMYVDNAYISADTLTLPRANVCSAPQTTIVSGPSATGNGSSASFRLSSSIPGSTFECRQDSQQAWGHCLTGYWFTDRPDGDQPVVYISRLADGEHTLDVRAIDPANNQDPTPAHWTWTADGEANGNSNHPAMSGDLRTVAFASDASNLVEGDTNGQQDIFVQTRPELVDPYVFEHATETYERVSVSSNGGQSNGASYDPSISDDGRFVAFRSDSSNLVPGDTNRSSDDFVYDRLSKTITRASVTDTGAEIGSCPPVPQSCSSTLAPAGTMPSISGDGRYLSFVSEQGSVVAGGPTGPGRQIYVYDRVLGRTVDWATVGVGGAVGGGRTPVISSDGRYVAFASAAANLVANDTNGASDVFVRDRTTALTSRASVTTSGAQANASSANPAISDDGRYVAFDSTASNLAVTDVAGAPDTDTNGVSDVFRRDRTTNRTYRVSKANASSPEPNGGSFSPSISGNGQTVAFESDANNNSDAQFHVDANDARDVFTWADASGDITAHSVWFFSAQFHTGNGPSSSISISTDGTTVAYKSDATDIENGEATFAGNARTGTEVLVNNIEPCTFSTYADRSDIYAQRCQSAATKAAAGAGSWQLFLNDYQLAFNECMAAFTTGVLDFPNYEEDFGKHGTEFTPAYPDKEKYREGAQEIVADPVYERCLGEDGRILYWVPDPLDPTKGAIVITQGGVITTYFRPTRGRDFYDEQCILRLP